MKCNVIPLRERLPHSEKLSDEGVAAACASGDPAAVAALFDRFHAPVTRFLWRLVHTPADVEDLLQSTFLEVARGHARFDGRSAVQTWLLGVAANVARHALRSKVRQSRMRLALAAERSHAVQPGSTEVVEARQQLTRVHQALTQLPAGQRVAFVLCEIEGFSAREAAAALGCAETAVWKRVSDARKAIRVALGRNSQ